MTNHRVEDTVDEWERKPIRDSRGIEFAVVNADLDFSVFLSDNDDGA